MPATSDEYFVQPRYLAGAGQISRVIQPLDWVHEWQIDNRPAANRVAATSPCRRIEVLAEHQPFHLWRVSVRSRPEDANPLWQATFTQETPAEIVGALVQALAADRYVAPEEIVAEWPGHPSTAWRPLLKAGWTPPEPTGWKRVGEPDGTEATPAPDVESFQLTSPDGKASLTHTPKDDRFFDTGVGPWQVDVSFGPAWQDQWTAILSARTPVRYLTMLTSAIADPAPVVRTDAQISTATRAAAAVRKAPRQHASPFNFLVYQLASTDPRHPYQGHPSPYGRHPIR